MKMRKIITRNNARCGLQYFSVNPAYRHTIEKCLYVPQFSLDNNYDDFVSEAIALNTAKKIYEIFGNHEQAEIKRTELQELIQSVTA